MGPGLWRSASTLIVLARNRLGQTGNSANSYLNGTSQQLPDFSCMLLKRSATSKFFAKAYVFPGGAVELADFSVPWLDHFAKNGYGREQLASEFIIPHKTRIPLYQDCPNHSDCIPEVGYRISAIRETFEETGVLICKPVKNLKSVSELDLIKDLPEWQERVHQNPEEFLLLCKTYGLCPDIWSLYEWSNWLTPEHLGSKRYDTIFYICVLNNIPSVHIDGKEITEVRWIDPICAVSDHVRSHIWLGPPQMYELCRLAHFNHGDDLEMFAKERQNLGIERWLPIGFKTNSGLVTVLPGDSLYPTGETHNVAFDEKEIDFESSGKRRNRMHFANPSLFRIGCNIDDPHGHKRPSNLFDEVTKAMMESKL